ncbi:MAG: ATP-binding protein, partial [Gammaproteobacteria bacterium]|nr:ATP-binding protein [Gammaproteobacteria bacterium]
MRQKFRGPRLGTKLLILMSFALVVIPWFSYLYLKEMENFLVDSQANAQLLTAEGVSTLLNGRADLFYELPISPEGYQQLYAHSLSSPVRLDGKSNDWEEILVYKVTFGTSSKLDEALITGTQESELDSELHDADAADSVDDAAAGELTEPATGNPTDQTDRTGPESAQPFSVLMGEHNEQIYALIEVTDNSLVYRDNRILRLDQADHVRITYTGQDGDIKRAVITMTEPGVTSAYPVDPDWRFATQPSADNRIQGFMAESETGYTIEFRIPLSLFGSYRTFGLATVDVDDSQTREIQSVTGSLPTAGTQGYGLVLLKSPEVLKIVEGLGYSGATIQVIDSRHRVRAEVGSYVARQIRNDDDEERNALYWFSAIMDKIYNLVDAPFRSSSKLPPGQVIRDSLAGKPSFERRFTEDEGEVIIAAHPIIAEDDIIGTIVITQNTNRILQLRRDALEKIINFSVLSLFIFVMFIIAFSVRLARRIRKLGAEATDAIDPYGRLKTNKLTSETGSGDEIGDLARSISGMLARLHQHNQFLENMPRTLRHEINNPLNILSTSLENLQEETTPEGKERYLESAKRGVNRIGLIVQNLADAANLEDALAAEESEVIDLHQLVESYLQNFKASHPERCFEYRGVRRQVLTNVSDFRIEQLLDKLIDNAMDFSAKGSTITVGLATDPYRATVYVTNQGPTIPAEKIDNIFDSM